MTRIGGRVTRFLMFGLAAGCGGGWHRVEPKPEQDYPPRQQVQVWSNGKARVLHGVSLIGDSLIGIPYHQSLECDSCAVSVPLARVDSLRLGNMERGAYRSIGVGFLAVSVLTGILWLSVDHD
jgi:hypothetical protein